VATSPPTYSGFPLNAIAALRYKKHTHKMPLTAKGRGYGAADGAPEHSLVVSLWAAGLGAHPNSGPHPCAPPARCTDAAPRACRSLEGASQAELYYVAPATSSDKPYKKPRQRLPSAMPCKAGGKPGHPGHR